MDRSVLDQSRACFTETNLKCWLTSKEVVVRQCLMHVDLSVTNNQKASVKCLILILFCITTQFIVCSLHVY